MAGNSVDYIIRLLSDDSQLKKQLQSSEKDISNLNAHERAEVKTTFQTKMKGIKLLAKAAKSNPSNAGVAQNLEKETQELLSAFKALQELNPGAEWAKNGKAFAQTFSDMHNQLNTLVTDMATLKSTIEDLGTSFQGLGFNIEPTVDLKSVTQNVGKTVKGVADAAVSEIHKVAPKIEKAYAKALQFNRDLGKVRGQKKYSFETSQEIENHLKQLQRNFNTASDDTRKYFNPQQAALYAQEIIGLYKWMQQAEKKNKFVVSTPIDDYDLEYYRSFVEEQVQIAEDAVQQYNRALDDTQMLNLTDKLTKNLKNLNIRLDLEPKAEFTKKVNKYIDDINKKNLHKVKVKFDDAWKPTTTKKKKKDVDSNQDTKANQEADEILEQSGLNKVTKTLDRITTKTTEWRGAMKKLLQFGKGDFQFDFGNTLMKDLQDYFYEPGHELDIMINEDELKRRIENVVKESGGVIGSSSGTATFDPKTMASAVYSAIQAALTGKEMPVLDFGDTTTTAAVEEVGHATEEVTDSTKTYVKTLDESTIHIDKVIEALKKFATIAPNSKAGKAISQWFSDRGIDMSLVRAGVDDAEIRAMLQEAWMLEDKMGHAQGSTVVDQLSKFFSKYKLKPDKGAGKYLDVLTKQIAELFQMLEIPMETVAEWKQRVDNVTIEQDAVKYGRGLALLNKFRPHLKTDKDGHRTGRAIKEGATADDISKIKLDDINKTIEYFAKIGLDTKHLEELRDARVALGDSTNSEDIKAFQDMVATFYANSRRVFEFLNKKYGEFAGDVYIKGRKNPIPVQNPRDILNKIPEDAIVVDTVIYNDMGSAGVLEWDQRKEENRLLRQQGRQSHQSKKEYEQDILNTDIHVTPFNPKEAIDTTTRLGAEHFDQRLQKVNQEITEIRQRLAEEKKTVVELSEIKSQLEDEIAQLVGEDGVSKINNATFKVLDQSRDSIQGVIRRAQASLMSGDTLELDSQQRDNEIATRLQSVLDNIRSDTNTSHDLTKKIGEIERAQSLNREELELWRSRAGDLAKAQQQKNQYQAAINLLKTQLDKGEITSKIYNKSVATHQRGIKQADKDIISLTKLFDGRPTDVDFYQNLLFNPEQVNQKLAEYKSQQEQATTRVNKNKAQASNLIKELEGQSSTIFNQALEEAKLLVTKLIEVKDKLYAEAESYVAILNNPSIDQTTREATTGKLQQTLTTLNKVAGTYAGIPLDYRNVIGTSFYNNQQQTNVDKWNKGYTNQEIARLERELATLNTQLEQEQDETQIKELKKRITNVKRQLTRRKNQTPGNVVGVRNGNLSTINSDLTRAQSQVNTDTARLTALESEAKTLNRNKSNAQFLESYRALLDKEKALLQEINNLKAAGANQKDIDAKLTEYTKVQNDIQELYQKGQTLDRKSYALEAAVDYRLQLIKAHEKQRALKDSVKDYDRWENELKEYGLHRRYGERQYSQYKYHKTDEFREQVRAQLKERLGLNDPKFQVDKSQMSEEVWNLRQQLFETLDRQVDAVVAQFKDSFTHTKGVVSWSDFDWDDETQSVIQKGSHTEDLLSTLFDTLKTMRHNALFYKDDKGKEIDRIKELDGIIVALKAERDKAMAYGGITYEDIQNNDIVSEQIKYQAEIDKLVARKEAIEADESLDEKAKEKQLTLLNQEIQDYQRLILNREKLIELRAKEKEASKWTTEERQIYYTDQLIKSKERIKQIDGEIATLEKEMHTATEQYGKDSREAAVAKEAYNRAITSRQRAIDTMAHANKQLGYANDYIAKHSVSQTETPQSGGVVGNILSTIKEGLASISGGTIDVDNSDIATETTLRAIFEMLSGGGQASADLDAQKALLKEERDARRKEEQKRVIAAEKQRRTEQTSEGGASKKSKTAQAKDLLNADGQQQFNTIKKAGADVLKEFKELDKQAILSKMGDQVKKLNGMTKNTAEYVQEQYKLANMMFAYKGKLEADGVTSHTRKNGTKYLDNKAVTERSEVKALGDVKSLMVTSVKDIADELTKLGYGAQLARNKKKTDINKLDDDALVQRFRHLLQLLEEEKATDAERTELNQITDILKSKGLIQGKPSHKKNVAETPVKANVTSKTEDLNSLDDEALINKFVELQHLTDTDTITESQLVEFQKVIELIMERGLNSEDGDEEFDDDGTDEEKQAILDAINNVGAKVVADQTENTAPQIDNNQPTEKSTTSQGGIIGIMRSELAQESTLKQVLTALGEIAKKNAIAGAGKANSAQDLLEQFRRMLESDAWEGKERVAYIDLATGTMSNSITGNDKSISAERLNILRSAYKDVMDLNAQVHTHANEDDPYFSKDDLSLFASDFADGITKQILLSKNNMTVLDMTSVQDVNSLLDALAKTEQNFEALATTADKFGAKYVSRAFNEMTPQGLVKMLGIKGIESKYTEAETRDSAVQGMLKEDAKVAADMLQESTGRAVKKTVERVGAELMTTTEKTDAKGNKTWSKQISDKYTKAAMATNKAFINLGLDKEFGIGTDAQLALVDYTNKYTEFLHLTEEFKKNPQQEGLQTQFDKLLPELDAAEEKLNKLIVSKDKFLNGKEAIQIFKGADLANTGDSLKNLATARYTKNGLNPGDNIAFNGISETPNGTRLLVDILKDGTIQQYALEVDRATGQVKEFMTAETALANAFQNVNKAMRYNETVMANVAIGNDPAEQGAFMNNAHSFGLDAYREAMANMEKYVADIWNRMANGGASASKEELDYIMALSERVIALGKNVQKTSIDFKNFWAQNPDNVFGHTIYHQGYNRDERVREELESRATQYARANNAAYNFSSFDNDTLQFTLTDVEGKISKVTYQWNELYQQIVMVSDKSTSALDPVVAKINRYDEVLQQAVNDGYLMAEDKNFDAFYKVQDGIRFLVDGIKNGNETFDTVKDKLVELRQEALKYGEATKKTIAQNKRLFAGTGAKKQVDNQYNKIFGAVQAGDVNIVDDSQLFTNYTSAYKQLNVDYETYVKNHQLNDPKIQQQIQQQAAQVQILGKRFLASVTQAEKLSGLVEQSGFFKDKRTGIERSLGGTTGVTAEEVGNLEAKMRDFVQNGLQQANIEGVKFDAVNQRMTYTFRTSESAVSDMVVQYNEATKALYAYQKQERESLTGFAGFMQSMHAKMRSILQYTASITSIYRIWGELRRGIQYIREIDSALTELRKVTDETEETYNRFLNTAAKTADKVGSTIKEVVSSTADFARLGYTLQDAAQMAESAQVLMNVSEFTDINTATDSLISAIQAFSYTADESMHVVDIMNTIGNRYAISTADLASSLTRSSAALVAAGNTMEEAVALTAAANTIIQDADSVGNALKTVSMRIRGTSVKELEEAGEDTDGLVENTSKLYSKIKALTTVGGKAGISILGDDGKYLNTYEILTQIAERWEEITEVGNDAALLELIAGKTRGSVVAALLQQPEILRSAYKDAMDAEGSALKENERYLDSIQGRIDLFNNAVQTMWQNTLDSSVVKGIVDIGTGLIKVVDQLGLVKTLVFTIGTYLVQKHFKGDLFGGMFGESVDEMRTHLKSLQDEVAKAQTAWDNNHSKDNKKHLNQSTKAYEAYKAQAEPHILKDDLQKKLSSLTEKSKTLQHELSAAEQEVADLWAAGGSGDADLSTEFEHASSKVDTLKRKIEDNNHVIGQTKVELEKVEKQTQSMGTAGLNAFQKIKQGAQSAWTNIKTLGKEMLKSMAYAAAMAAIFESVSIILEGVTWVFGKLFDALPTFENLQEKLEQTQSELSDVESELRNLNSELDDTNDRIDELMKQDSLSYVEQEELTKLKAATAELKAQIGLQETLQKSLQSNVNSQAIEATDAYLDTSFMNDKTRTETQEEWGETGKKFGTVIGTGVGIAATSAISAGLIATGSKIGGTIGTLLGGPIGTAIGIAAGSAIFGGIGYLIGKGAAGASYDSEQTVGEAMDSMIAKRKELIALQDEALANNDAEALNEATEALRTYDNQMAKHISQIQQNYNSMDWSVATDDQKQQMMDYADWLSKYNIAMGTLGAKSNAIERIFGGAEASHTLKTIDKYMKDLVKSGAEIDFYEWFDNTIPEETKARLAELGITLTDLKYYYLDWQTTEEEVTSNTYDAIQAVDNLTDGIGALKDAFGEFSEEGLVSVKTLVSLHETFGSLGDAWDDYVDTMATGTTSTKDAQKATEELLEAFMSARLDQGPIADMKEYLALIGQLQSLGVTNAKGYVDALQKASMMSGVAQDVVNQAKSIAELEAKRENNEITDEEYNNQKALLSQTPEDFIKQYEKDYGITFSAEERLVIEKAITAEKAKQAAIEAQTKANEYKNAQYEQEQSEQQITAIQNQIDQKKKEEQEYLNAAQMYADARTHSVNSQEQMQLAEEQRKYKQKAKDVASEIATLESEIEKLQPSTELTVDVVTQADVDQANQYAEETEAAYQAALDDIGLTLEIELITAEQAVDDIQSVYDTLMDAATEYNENGYFTVDTLQSLLALEPKYLTMLMNEQGQLEFNKQAILNVAQARLFDMTQKQIDSIITSASNAAKDGEIDKLNELTSMLYEAADAQHAFNVSKMAELRTNLANEELGLSQAEQNSYYNAIQSQIDAAIAAYNHTVSNLPKAMTGGGKSTGGDSDENALLDSLREKYERQITNLDNQVTYLENEVSLLEAKHEGVSKKYYEQQNDLIKEKITLLEREHTELLKLERTDEVAAALWEVEHQLQEANINLADNVQKIVDLYKNAFDEIGKAYDNQDDLFSDRQNYIEKYRELLELQDSPEAASGYQEQIALEADKMAANTNKLADLQELLARGVASGYLKEGSDEWIEMQDEIRATEEAILDSKIALEQYKEEMKDLQIEAWNTVRDAFDNKNQYYQNQQDYIEGYADYLEALGVDVPDELYDKLISIEEEKRANLVADLTDARATFDQLVADGVMEDSEDYQEAYQKVVDLEKGILDCDIAMAQWAKTMRDMDFEKFERFISRLDDLKSEIEHIQNLLDDEDVAFEDGTWTKEGITMLGLYYQQMQLAQQESKEYAKKIEELNNTYAEGTMSEQEYYERLQELKDGQWEAIESYESAKDAIVDMEEARIDQIENGVEKEISAYEELISLKKEELDAERD